MPKQILEQENKSPDIIHVEPREAVKALLTKLKDVKADIQQATDLLDQDILNDIESYKAKETAIEAEIKELVSFEVQESIKTNDGCANFRLGTKRVSYDGKLLDAIQDEKIRKAIDPARKETQVKGSVIVEVY